MYKRQGLYKIKEKEAIAKTAAQLVGDGEVIYIDAGTTCLKMIPYLKNKKITVVTTNAMVVPSILETEINVIMIGGDVLKSTASKMCIRDSYAGGKGLKVSIEYKPCEPRAFSMIDGIGLTLQMIDEVDRPNIGVTLDFCHMLMKRENPAYSLALAARKNKLYGLHMNDGYGELDNGLIFASVSMPQALEFVYYLKKYNYDEVVFFDSFPIREEAQQEVSANIKAFKALSNAIDSYGMDRIEEVIKEQDGIKAQKLVLDMFSK